MFRFPKDEEHRQKWIYFFYARQASGRNVFISVQQLMLAEKKEY